MSRHRIPQSHGRLSRALAKMSDALEILDGLGAPAEIASHLDLAIARLEAQLGMGSHLAAQAEILIARLAAEPSSAGEERAPPSNPWKNPPV